MIAATQGGQTAVIPNAEGSRTTPSVVAFTPLAGPSGSGKTLAVYTLLRFADLAAGTLTVDGTDARDLPPERVRALLAWSPEQPILFPASLRANLRLGAPQATDGEVTELPGRFGPGPWLDRLECGLD